MKLLLPSVLLAVGLTAEAREITAEYVVQSGASETLEVNTSAPEYPDMTVGTPAFWLDASVRTGWTMAGDDITTIPTRLGGTRTLTIDFEGGDWSGWAGSTKPLPPTLVYDSELKAYVVDFGAIGSRKGLVFSPEEGSNELTGIGTVIAVYGSQAGGGFFLGGGYGEKGGYGWHRGTGSMLLESGFEYDAPLFQTAAYASLYAAPVRHDGLLTSPTKTGLSGGWEIVSVMPTVATAQATGVGLGDTRGYNYSVRSGGMKIAEMLIYDKVLSESEVEQVETYLRAKWFGQATRGKRGGTEIGRLRTYGGTTETLSVPAEETLAVNELRGRDTETLVKTGEGALRLANAENYGGKVQLEGGTLEFPGQAVPTELPHDLYLRFDASDADSITIAEQGGKQYVVGWNSQVAGTYQGKEVSLASSDSAASPVFEADALGTGLNAIDFGATAEAGQGGGLLAFGTSGTQITLPHIHTMIAVMNVKNGGGYMLSSSEYWRAGGGQKFTDGFIDADKELTTNPTITSSDVHTWLDGVRVPSTTSDTERSGFRHPGWHVFAEQTGSGCSASLFGARYDGYSGGAKYAEVLIWNRTLSDEEIRQATAYLEEKWFSKRTPGYAAVTETQVPDVQQVEVAGESAISVGAGDTVRVGKLSVNAPLVKRGAGTLEVNKITAASELSVEAGRVDFVKPEVPLTDSEVAPGAALHIDASLASSLMLVESDRKYVRRWADVSGFGGVVQESSGYRPWLNETDLCNGLPTVDFGTFGTQSSTGGRYIDFCRSLDNVRHVFIVWGAQEGGGFLLGTSTDTSAGDAGTSGVIDFCREDNNSGLVLENVNTKAVRDGRIFIDGETFAWNATPENKYQLLEYHPASGARVAGFCLDRYISVRYGGARIGEAIFYERELNEAEIVATRNYLNAKWFGRAAQALPTVTDPENVIGKMANTTETTLNVEAAVRMQELAGESTLTKTGSGVLSVEDFSNFSGQLTVSAGTLKLPLKSATSAGALVTEGRILHVDAAQGVVCETNSAGVVYVKEWQSLLDDGWVCEAHGRNGVYPTLMTAENGNDPGFSGAAHALPAVDMLAGSDAAQYFTFKKDGVQTELTEIRTVFWVLGSQRGGGWMMGGGTIKETTHHAYLWHRGGGGTGSVASDAILNGTFGDSIGLGAWRINGTAVNPKTTGLSGGWDLLSLVTYGDTPATADGFAFDGRILDGMSAVAVRDGAQRLGEVIVYNRKLSDAEVAQMENYLAVKWGFVHADSSATVELKADTTLDCGGFTQHLGTLAGSGAVVNGTLSADKICCDGVSGNEPEVESFAVPSVLTVDFGDTVLSAEALQGDIPVLRADQFTGEENLKNAVITGNNLPAGTMLKLKVKDGVLVTTPVRGLLIIWK